ncbi:hypothetical protein [Wolbachia pipientis]|nr:hypothetical protein WANA34_0864 [Wolbachia endosymbiont of Drosophila ananassae]RLT61091.1 hypothetical protein WANA31_0313 [Wolbachia endosymbiont of Drosophila ananassae]RLT62764.1 hypothetical protein WANA13_0941 [Wolbachia endosymbiont of Drosophila ananassae]
MSGHWDDKKGGTRMTKESYSDDTFFYLVWVMQEVYYNQALSVRK